MEHKKINKTLLLIGFLLLAPIVTAVTVTTLISTGTVSCPSGYDYCYFEVWRSNTKLTSIKVYPNQDLTTKLVGYKKTTTTTTTIPISPTTFNIIPSSGISAIPASCLEVTLSSGNVINFPNQPSSLQSGTTIYSTNYFIVKNVCPQRIQLVFAVNDYPALAGASLCPNSNVLEAKNIYFSHDSVTWYQAKHYDPSKAFAQRGSYIGTLNQGETKAFAIKINVPIPCIGTWNLNNNYNYIFAFTGG